MDVHSNRRAMQWWSKGAVVILGTLTLSPGTGIALASDTATRPTIGDTTIFASAPAPGHLFGVAVDNDRIYVATSAGDFFADPPASGYLRTTEAAGWSRRPSSPRGRTRTWVCSVSRWTETQGRIVSSTSRT